MRTRRMLMPSPIAASISSADAMAEELDRHRVLPRERLDTVMPGFPGGGPLRLAEYLIARGDLTPFQAERTLAGQAKSLVLGPYRLLEPHHIGTFGPIFRAVKGETQVALRVLPLRSLWQAKQAKQLVRTLSTLHSAPSVMPLIDADSANGSHYLVWPLAPGELLADRISTLGPFDHMTAIELLKALASALAACHAAQVVHGLLTPQAVCIERSGALRLLEVGAGLLLAHNLASDDSLFDTMSESLAVAGAFDFAAPEWVAEPAHPTPAADQYSLGSLGCFVLTGSAPPAGMPPTWPSDTPRELIEILNRMRQPDPASRFASMRDVQAALAGIGRKHNAAVETDPADQPSWRTSPRDPVIEQEDSNEADWHEAEEQLHPVERDETEASIHFDLPQLPVEDTFPFAPPLGLESRETPPPTQWRTIAHPLKSAPAPPADAESDAALEPLPSLPAAPLPPLASEPSSSSTWAAVGRAPGTTKKAEDKPGSAIWKRLKRKVRFWQTTGDMIQISAFGPPWTMHSASPRLTVFLHPASAAASVATLARAFHHDAVLLGTGPLPQPVVRGERLDVHVAIDHASVSNPLGGFKWQGQPHRLTFDFVVPWEAPIGVASGTVSVGRDEVRIGKLEFGLPIRDGAV